MTTAGEVIIAFRGLELENEQLQEHNKYVLDLIKAERIRQEECDDIHLRNIATLEKENQQLRKQIKNLEIRLKGFYE